MAEKNPYYIDNSDTFNLTQEQAKAAKYNNYFLMSIFTNLVAENGTNAETVVPSTFLPGLLLGNLPKKDDQTGLESKHLGGKIKYLLQSLKSNKEAQKFFSDSFFSQLIECFRRGTTTGDANDQWVAYKPTAACEERYKTKDPFAVALIFYSKNDKIPVGINFAKIIDCLIVTNNRGEYSFRQNFDKFGQEATLMTAACDMYLKSLKSNYMFAKSFEPTDEKFSDIE